MTARLLPVVALAAITAAPVRTQVVDTVFIRGRPQIVHLYGSRGSGDPVIVSSGDGGWTHLGPEIAETLAARGFFVVGFDVRRYLQSFTSSSATLRLEDEPCDYRQLIEYAARGSSASGRKPILIGVSEGAGLSVLAATNPAARYAVSGVVGVGLPLVNELGWRWKDAVIYITHRVPDEPTFDTAAMVKRMTPAPLAAISSARDEFVSVPEIRKIMESANEPKKLWVVNSSDHRFSDNLTEFNRLLLEAIDWVTEHQTQ